MKYFEIFGWEPHFNIDLSELKKKYHGLSRESHPDFFTQASEDAKSNSLSDSTELNQAYKTLKSPKLLLKYILEQEGVVLEGSEVSMSQTFLMEMMEINEAIMEMQLEEDQSKLVEIKKAFEERVEALEQSGEKLKNAYDRGIRQEGFVELRQYYFEMKYLDRMRENLNNEEVDI